MKNTNFTVTEPHPFLPISALRAESNSYIIKLRFKFHETLQINQTKFSYFQIILTGRDL